MKATERSRLIEERSGLVSRAIAGHAGDSDSHQMLPIVERCGSDKSARVLLEEGSRGALRGVVQVFVARAPMSANVVVNIGWIVE